MPGESVTAEEKNVAPGHVEASDLGVGLRPPIELDDVGDRRLAPATTASGHAAWRHRGRVIAFLEAGLDDELAGDSSSERRRPRGRPLLEKQHFEELKRLVAR
jgi:hypothetical protein